MSGWAEKACLTGDGKLRFQGRKQSFGPREVHALLSVRVVSVSFGNACRDRDSILHHVIGEALHFSASALSHGLHDFAAKKDRLLPYLEVTDTGCHKSNVTDFRVCSGIKVRESEAKHCLIIHGVLMNLSRSVLFVVMCAALSLPGCTGGTEPSSKVDGRFSLLLVNDRVLPAVIANVGFSGRQERVVSGRLALSGSRVIQVTDYDYRESSGVTVPTMHDSVSGSFRVRGESIILTRVSSGVTLVDTGYYSDSLIIVQQRLKTGTGLLTTQRYTLKYVPELVTTPTRD